MNESPIDIQHGFYNVFSIVRSTFDKVGSRIFVFFLVLHVLKSFSLKWIFSLGTNRLTYRVRLEESERYWIYTNMIRQSYQICFRISFFKLALTHPNSWLGWVWFDGISNIVGYLMPNTLYTYIKYMICKHILLITLWAHLFLCTRLNGFKHWYLLLTIQLNISHLFIHS